MNDADRRLQDQARTLWMREGGHCVSSLVHTLAAQAFDEGVMGDLGDITNQAFELSTPIDDWESAALEAGWTTDEDTGNGVRWTRPEGEADRANDDGPPYCDTAQEACEFDHIEPHQREVYEHWIVSDWLADQLVERGEKIDKDFAGLTIWARTTTGQAVYCDWVIEQIAKDLHSSVEG